MTPYRIPESAYAAIQHLVQLDERDFGVLLDALARAEPSLDKEKFWTHVAKHASKVDEPVVESVVNEIFELDDVRNDREIHEFADLIAEAALEANSEKFPFAKKDLEILKDRLLKIFDGRKGLEITMKGMGVLVEQDHIFIDPRIVTDVRPIFNTKGDSVDAAVIVHNLRIHYAVNSEHKDFYVALDTGDVQLLREALDRADQKAKCLQGLLKSSGVSYLDAEE